MRIRRKSNSCLNCNASLDGIYNYCPICGQENNNNNISFGKLFLEFFSNWLSFDSRMGKSIVPFFFKPGFLTNAYNRGLRVSYMHPVRLYLIISILFFFVFQLASSRIVSEGLEEANAWKRDTRGQKEKLLTEVKGNLKDVKNPDSVAAAIDSAFIEPFVSINLGEKDSLVGNIDGKDIAKNVAGEIAKNQKNIPDSANKKNNFQIVEDYLDDRTITDSMVYDSLDVKGSGDFEKYFWRQYIRVRRSDEQFLTNYVVDNLPLMMLFLLPIFAALLKLLYVRRNILYIKHLIHAFHIHSFAYMIYAIVLLFVIFNLGNESLNSWLTFISIIVVTTYCFISFMKVYKQRFFKTFVKFSLLGFIYMFCLFIFFLGEIFVSFLMY